MKPAEIFKEITLKEKNGFYTTYPVGADAEDVLIKNASGTAYGDRDGHKNLQSKLNKIDSMIRTDGAAGDATGKCATAFGLGTQATGNGSHAEGGRSVVKGHYSHVEGYDNQAYGDNSHVEGKNNIGRGEAVHIEGIGNKELTPETETTIPLPSQIISTKTIRLDYFEQEEEGFSIEGSQYSYKYNPTGPDCAVYLDMDIQPNIYYKGYIRFEEESSVRKEILLYANEFYGDKSAPIPIIYTKEELYGSVWIILTEKIDYVSLVEGAHIQGTYNAVAEDCIHIVGNGTSDLQRSNAHTLNKYGAAYFQGAISPSTIFLTDVSGLNPINYGIQIVNGELKTFVKTKSILMEKAPTKMEYRVGEPFLIEGAVFKKIDEKGNRFDLSSDKLDYPATVPENFKIQVSYIEHGFKYVTEIQLKAPGMYEDDFTWDERPIGLVATEWKGTTAGQIDTKIIFPEKNWF